MHRDRLSSRSDQIIGIFDGLLRNISGHTAEDDVDEYPAGPPEMEELSGAERQHGAALMRVNHVGEVCAQALYAGQAVVASDPVVATSMREAANEELAHLKWCETRIDELGGRTSLLNPIWAGGSLLIGMLAGLAGDQKSLGFIEETEAQVCAHLDRHLKDLPADDVRSRKIIQQMRADEARHAARAKELGAKKLSSVTRTLMKLQAKVMTTVAYRI
ncbi:MAG: 2-polyprenyl-3-methyl-6-methoxy-1,4-benzoquinone monooxygenase [Gammaproteobacteria bacterium]